MTFVVSKKFLLDGIRAAAPSPALAELRWDLSESYDGDQIVNVWLIFDDASYAKAVKASGDNSWKAVEPVHRAASEAFWRWLPSRRPHVHTRTAKEQAQIDKNPTYRRDDGHEALEPDKSVVVDERLLDLERRLFALEEASRPSIGSDDVHLFDGADPSKECLSCDERGESPNHYMGRGVVCDVEEGFCACGARHGPGDHRRKD